MVKTVATMTLVPCVQRDLDSRPNEARPLRRGAVSVSPSSRAGEYSAEMRPIKYEE